MNEPDQFREGKTRAQRALERETRAQAHERAAHRRAEEAGDPEIARAHEREAETHARAANLHHEAAQLQARHAEEHAGE